MMIEYFNFPTAMEIGTRTALANYWMLGIHPGSFTTALLQGNLFRAVACADHHNKQCLCEITQWVELNAPPGSFGSSLAVYRWLNDVNQIRSTYARRRERDYVIQTLSTSVKQTLNTPQYYNTNVDNLLNEFQKVVYIFSEIKEQDHVKQTVAAGTQEY
jgi:hypothetical protein